MKPLYVKLLLWYTRSLSFASDRIYHAGVLALCEARTADSKARGVRERNTPISVATTAEKVSIQSGLKVLWRVFCRLAAHGARDTATIAVIVDGHGGVSGMCEREGRSEG